MFKANLVAKLKRINAQVNDLEALLGMAEIESTPPHLEVDFSSKCNLRCPMCHQSKFEMGNVQLGADAIDAMINGLPAIDTVMIAGLGEPLLYRDLEHFLSYLARYQCRTHLFTNGQLIHRKLAVLKLVQRVSVSFDGATRGTFETLRRGAQFARVCENIRLLRAAAPKTLIVTSTVISNRNLDELAAIVRLAQQLGMDEVHLSPVDHTPALMLTENDLACFQAQLAQAKTVRGIRLFNNIHPRHFAPERNSRISQGDQWLAKQLSRPAVAQDEPPDGDPKRTVARQYIHGMSRQDQQLELLRRIDRLSARLRVLLELRKQRTQSLELPYCSAPWKYGFAQSKGQARLCPYADVPLGAVSDVLAGDYNAPLLVAVRRSLAQCDPTLAVCRTCTDDHRQFRRDTLEATMASDSRLTRWKLKARRLVRRANRALATRS